MNIFQAIVQGIFSHYVSKGPQHNYEYLANSPVLHSTDYLTDMLRAADTKEKEDCILDHIYKHGAYYDGYGEIEKQIIKKRL